MTNIKNWREKLTMTMSKFNDFSKQKKLGSVAKNDGLLGSNKALQIVSMLVLSILYNNN